MTLDEKNLVEGLKAGEEESYRILYKQYYASLCNYANGIIRDEFAAESIVSLVLFHIWEIRSTLSIKTSIKLYLFTAVRNKCLDYIKLDRIKKTTLFGSLNDMEKIPGLVDLPLNDLISRELQSRMEKSVEQLPAETKVVFKKSRFENKCHQEIADEVGISISTVKYHIGRALVLLSESLEEFFKK